MSTHRLHKGRVRFRIFRTTWEVLSRKSAVMKSGELAPKMRISPQQRSEVEGMILDQEVNYDVETSNSTSNSKER